MGDSILEFEQPLDLQPPSFLNLRQEDLGADEAPPFASEWILSLVEKPVEKAGRQR
jgi:hypothetical protein